MQSEKVLPQYHKKLICSTAIWGLETPRQFGPQLTFTLRVFSNTNTGKGDGRRHARSLSASTDKIPTNKTLTPGEAALGLLWFS